MQLLLLLDFTVDSSKSGSKSRVGQMSCWCFLHVLLQSCSAVQLHIHNQKHKSLLGKHLPYVLPVLICLDLNAQQNKSPSAQSHDSNTSFSLTSQPGLPPVSLILKLLEGSFFSVKMEMKQSILPVGGKKRTSRNLWSPVPLSFSGSFLSKLGELQGVVAEFLRWLCWTGFLGCCGTVTSLLAVWDKAWEFYPCSLCLGNSTQWDCIV